MVDEKLAKGLARRFLHDLGNRLPGAIDDLDALIEKAPRNLKGMRRRIDRLERRHHPVVGPILCTREAGAVRAIVPYWRLAGLAVVGGDYKQSGSLTSAGAIVEVSRGGVETRSIDGPVMVHQHALGRLIERDTALPPYDLAAWLQHLTPALMIAIGLSKHAIADHDQRAVALPTRGGLFVGFLLKVGGWCVSCHSFLGFHELGEPEQRLHADLLAACEADDIAAVMAIHDAHRPLWLGERPMLLRAAKKMRINDVA